jgi:hypothetical protein
VGFFDKIGQGSVPVPDVTQLWVVEIVKVQDILYFVISGYLRDPNEKKMLF